MNYIGEKFNKLTIVEDAGSKSGKRYVLCECECGKIKVIRRQSVVSGTTKSCGGGVCVGRTNDITGKRFGKLYVESFSKIVNGRSLFNCKCDCGKQCEVEGHRLLQGSTVTCTKCNTNKYYSENDYMVGETSRGVKFYFDIKDFNIVSDRNWYSESEYFATKINGKHHKLHRYIMNYDGPLVVDHIDGNPANNRRNNLRICTQQQNVMNSKIRSDSTNNYRGVKYRGNGKYQARIQKDGKRYYIGTHRSEEAAAKAYNEKALELFGEYAKLNKIE